MFVGDFDDGQCHLLRIEHNRFRAHFQMAIDWLIVHMMPDVVDRIVVVILVENEIHRKVFEINFVGLEQKQRKAESDKCVNRFIVLVDDDSFGRNDEPFFVHLSSNFHMHRNRWMTRGK